MKMTRAASYAVHAVAHLARRSDRSKPVPSHIIAQEEGIPERFLLKVLKPLVQARVLESTKGPNGGYKLHREPADISLLSVVEAVDGPITGTAPEIVGEDGPVTRRMSDIYRQGASDFRERLENHSIAELIITASRKATVGNR